MHNEKSAPAMDGIEVEIAIIEKDAIHLLTLPHSIDVEVIFDCVSDDPTCLRDIALTWERHADEGITTLSFETIVHRTISEPELKQWLASKDDWIVIDLAQSRIFSGENSFLLVSICDESFSDSLDAAVIFTLPPWWELFRNANRDEVLSKRVSPAVRIDPQREVLWGNELPYFLANELVKATQTTPDWNSNIKRVATNTRWQLTKQIHKDWLMTPRTSLHGETPRMRLHLGKEWIADLVSDSFARLERGARNLPLPAEHTSFAIAPLGVHEIVTYFDACRAILESGWEWLLEKAATQADLSGTETELADHLTKSLSTWLESPFEGPYSPKLVIDIERMRLPLIDNQHEHDSDCDCPICHMQSLGNFGITQIVIDGHQLELDDEFAFSLFATKEEWDAEYMLVGRSSDEDEDQSEDEDFDDDWSDDEEDDDDWSDDDEDDDDWDDEEELEDLGQLDKSLWNNTTRDPLPGDQSGLMKMAFHLTEIMQHIDSQPVQNKWSNPENQKKVISDKFQDYVAAYITDLPLSKIQPKALALKNQIENIVKKYPKLRSQASDLQSQIDEQLRDLTT